MKKVILIFGALLFSSAALTSCGGGTGSIESDAKKIAELQCKAQQLIQKAASGDLSVIQESTRLASEATALSAELERKYSSASDKKTFAEALFKEMGHCK